MRISRLEGAVLFLTAVFLAFSAGWLARGALDAPPVRVEVERSSAAVVTIPTAAQEQEVPSTAPTVGTEAPSAAPTAEPEEEAPETASGKININTATAEELETLPGIGEKRAQAIVEDRQNHGPFRTVEELTRVKGIGEGILAGLIDGITV